MSSGEAIDTGDPARGRLIQVFRFLKDLNELRNPVPRDLSSYPEVFQLETWPVHPCVEIRRGVEAEPEAAPGERSAEPEDEDAGVEPSAAEVEPAPIARVRRAALSACPKPPPELDGWIAPGWASLEGALEMLSEPEPPVGSAPEVEVDPARIAALERWTVERARWIETERPALEARRLFERLHALWTRLEREGDRLELVLADGMLCIGAEGIRHPVLLQRLDLEFDPSLPEFRLTSGTERVELDRALLRLVRGLEGRWIAELDGELEARPVDPLGDGDTSGFLRRLVQGLFTDGEFLDRKPDAAATHPAIWREPLILLRTRHAGLSSMLEHVIESLERGDAEIPEGLRRIVGVEGGALPRAPSVGEGGPEPAAGPGADVLLSKPANAEQLEIARRLAETGAVLVQGPPGTGKTHTIANLLGHLLSEGKTVLVTAHTTKALRVLRDQVDPALRPLCLSVLEGDADTQAQLARAAQEIADRLSRSDVGALRGEAARLRDERRRQLAAARGLRAELRAARASEVEEIVVDGQATAPLEAARHLERDRRSDGWIPGPLVSGACPPLSASEVRELYALQGLLAPADEAELAVGRPALSGLVSEADFRRLVGERAGARERSRTHRPALWEERAGDARTSAELLDLQRRVQASAALLAEPEPWLREVLFAGWSGGGLREAWSDLLVAIEALAAQAGEAQRLAHEHGPELPAEIDPDRACALLGEIVAHLAGGGALGPWTKLTHRAWHGLARACRVGEHPPRTLAEFRALRARALLEGDRRRLVARWGRAVADAGGPELADAGEAPERTAQAHVPRIRARLEWRAKAWEPLIDELRAAGFRWDEWLADHPPVPGDHGELARLRRAASQGLAEVVGARAARLRQVELGAALAAQRAELAGHARSAVAQALLRAQDGWDAEAYAAARGELARLEGLRGAFETRRALLARLAQAAPLWAVALAERRPPHDAATPPGEPGDAWRWRAWLEELERRAAVSIPDLLERLARAEAEARRLAARIVELETWAAQRERTKLSEQQSLMGYVQTLRKIGKGTGKRAPQLVREARRLLVSARSAVPVWIMPLARVHESFDPRESRFDVVIIDEASQSDVTALAALYLGREHVVVGDKEQVTPDAIGQEVEAIERLIAAGLQGIPNRHLYDGQTSIYDLAETAFGGVVALREHFRCVPEIIQFSNQLSYGQAIRPLREPLSAALRPALVEHKVEGSRDGEATNPEEAGEIAALLVACLEQPEYALNELGRPTSFGVISLLGDAQALLVEQILRRSLPPDVLHERRLLCGNAAQFQGDERDVVFLSVVDGPPPSGQLSLRDAGPKDLYRKRYNVAASRARNQLWVVHSLDPDEHLKGGDLRRRLIAHARDPQALVRLLEREGSRDETSLAEEVRARLVAGGYRVRKNWRVGSHRIDLVVEGRARRLAVECDGERALDQDELERDLERQAVLERLGWAFVRVRGSVFVRDPERALAPLFARLAALGIEPLGPAEEPSAAELHERIVRVKRRARELRAAWRAEGLAPQR